MYPRALGVLFALLVLGISATLIGSARAEAADAADIASAGPLTHVYVDNRLACQFARAGDADLAFFDPTSIPGDCGTFVLVEGELFGPALRPGSTATGSLGPVTLFTPLAQSAVTGNGTPGNPFTLITTVDVGRTGLRLTETDTYVTGEDTYRTSITVANLGAAARTFRLYHAADCYAAGSDLGYGAADAASGSVACARNPNNAPAGRIEQFDPEPRADHYYEDYFDHVWMRIGAHEVLPDRCACETLYDNAIAIEWDRTLESARSVELALTTGITSSPPPAPPPAPPQVAPPPAQPPVPEPPPTLDEQPGEGGSTPPARANPSISTTVRNFAGVEVSAVPVGTTVHARVVLGGSGRAPSGTVTLQWFTSGTCGGTPSATSLALPLEGGPGATSAVDAVAFAQTPSTAGAYAFRARYSGDEAYSALTGACASLIVSATPECDDRGHGDDEHNGNKNGHDGHGRCAETPRGGERPAGEHRTSSPDASGADRREERGHGHDGGGHRDDVHGDRGHDDHDEHGDHEGREDHSSGDPHDEDHGGHGESHGGHEPGGH